MKFLAKWWMVLSLVVAIIFIWQWSQSSTGKEAVRKQTASASRKSKTPAGQSSKMEVARLSPEETLALIHLKLHQWLEVQARGGDDDDHSLADLEALLADANAVDIIQSLSADELNTPFGMDVLQQWAQKDLVAATNWIAANPDGMEDLTAVIAREWANHPGDVEDYTGQLPNSVWKQNFLLEVGSQLTASNPEEAISLAQQMNPGNDQANFLQSVAGDWIGRDPLAAREWIVSVDDPSLRERLIASAAKAYALTNPKQAAAWMVSTVETKEVREDAALNIISTWVTKDPQAAANWATLFPDGDAKNTALNLVANYWRQTDPNAANFWMQNFNAKF